MTRMLASLLPEILLVGLPEVDAQHEEIFSRIELLKVACFELEHAAVPVEALEDLRAFFTQHFATEEQIARQAALEFSEHTRVHKTNLRVLRKALDEVRSGVRDGYSFMRYVELWFERHIIEYDQPFAASLLTRRRYRSAPMPISASF